MKKKQIITILIASLLTCVLSLYAQDSLQITKIYQTWLKVNIHPLKIKGALYEIRDSSLVVSNSLSTNDYLSNNFTLHSVNVKNLNTIELREAHLAGNTAVIGGIIGLGLGIIGAFFSDLWIHPAATYTIFGSLGFTFGALLGYASESKKTVIPIDGSLDSYNQNKGKLSQYSIKK